MFVENKYLIWKLVDDWLLQEAGTNWSKAGTRNKLLRQDIEIHQHGSVRWISIATSTHNKDDNKQNEDDKLWLWWYKGKSKKSWSCLVSVNFINVICIFMKLLPFCLLGKVLYLNIFLKRIGTFGPMLPLCYSRKQLFLKQSLFLPVFLLTWNANEFTPC